MAFNKKTWANNQAGGTPLDASGLNDLESRIDDIGSGIIGTGSNVNGTFIKFENGLMICHVVKVLLTVGSQTGSWTFPADFDLTKPVTVLHSRATDLSYGGDDELYFDHNNYNLSAPHLLKSNSVKYRGVRNGYSYVYINIVAIGRWK